MPSAQVGSEARKKIRFNVKHITSSLNYFSGVITPSESNNTRPSDSSIAVTPGTTVANGTDNGASCGPPVVSEDSKHTGFPNTLKAELQGLEWRLLRCFQDELALFRNSNATDTNGQLPEKSAPDRGPSRSLLSCAPIIDESCGSSDEPIKITSAGSSGDIENVSLEDHDLDEGVCGPRSLPPSIADRGAPLRRSSKFTLISSLDSAECQINSSSRQHSYGPIASYDSWPGSSRRSSDRNGDTAVVQVASQDELLVPETVHEERTYKSAQSARSVRTKVSGTSMTLPSKASSDQVTRSHSKSVVRKSYEIHPVWEQEVAACRSSSMRKNHPISESAFTVDILRSVWAAGKVSISFDGQHLSAHPLSKRRLAWEALGVMFIIYDLTFIPLQAFDLPWKSQRYAILCVTSAYWTFDMPFHFLIGYMRNGIVETRIRHVARRYTRTWFFPDLLLVFVDWTVVALGPENDNKEEEMSFSLVRVGRVLRLLRFLRLARLFKVHSFISKLLEQVRSDYVITLANVSVFIVLIIVVNHFVACGWYLIGEESKGPRWINGVFSDHHTLAYRYLTSLHWSLTQFTPASMEVHPQNVAERAYSVIVLIFAMVMFSSAIGGITEAMTHLRKLNSKEHKNYNQLRRYFADNNVNSQLAMRIWQYLEQRSTLTQSRRNWSDVDLLQVLPESMQMDLKSEVYKPILMRHPFWFDFAESNSAPVRCICHQALTEDSLLAGQDVFTVNHPATHMRFVVNGMLVYYNYSQFDSTKSLSKAASRKSTESLVVQFNPADVDLDANALPNKLVSSEHFISEAAIWLRFFHAGTLLARPLSVLISLDAQELHKIVLQYHDSYEECKAYAVIYHERSTDTKLTDIDDDFARLQFMARQAFAMCENESSRWSRSTACTQVASGNTVASRAGFLGEVSAGIQRLRRMTFSKQRSNRSNQSGPTSNRSNQSGHASSGSPVCMGSMGSNMSDAKTSSKGSKTLSTSTI